MLGKQYNQAISELQIKDPAKYLKLPTLTHAAEELEALINLFQQAGNPKKADFLITDLLEKTLAFRYATAEDVLPFKTVDDLTLIFDDLAKVFLLLEIERESEYNENQADTLTDALSYCQLSLKYRISKWQLLPEQLIAWNNSLLRTYAEDRC